MLKKELRIRKQKDFDRIFSEGSFFSEGFLSIKVVKNNYKHPRFAFVVSNKISKKACERNYIRRMLRECVRLRIDSIIPSIDIVFIVRSNVSDRDFLAVDKVVDRLLKKSGLIKE